MADTLDSKSGALAGVWVQVPPSVPLKMITPSDSGGVFLFLCCSCYGEIRNLENLMILKSGVKKRSVKFRNRDVKNGDFQRFLTDFGAF